MFFQEMEDDNSCLFHAVGFALERNPDAAPKLRKVVADTIAGNPFDYNEAILGKPVDQYMKWIQQPASWGGAIELAIFSQHYQVEIDSIDVATLRVDREQYQRRILLIYSGIHYDAVALAPFADAPQDFDQTTFEGPASESILRAGLELAGALKKQHKFTDLATFTLRCGVCKVGLKGQKEAQQHAIATGHASFTEYA
ncbi:hypothetical protein BJ742DRAFT_679015 [Cladochytrium replicatum]|nr:hypothetical protein BJ742DRAFT_679015 [Cladochytrium replicatum]